jgi:hypothetical protein
VQLHDETLRIRERVLGPEHPDTLTSRGNLEELYEELYKDNSSNEKRGWLRKFFSLRNW